MNDSRHDSPAPRFLIGGTVLGLTLLALGLRVWRLGEIPTGLHFDEAAHGLLVESTIFRGQFPVFFSSYTGHEALYHYTLAPILALLGPTILAARLPAALWSAGLVPVVYALGTRFWSWRVGVMAAIATACGGWLLHIGRIGFRANTLPVISGLAVLLLYRALMTQRRHRWIASGALFGLSLYTYLAARALPLFGLLLLIYLAIFHRGLLQRSRRGMLLFTLALVIVATPLIYHMTQTPGDLLARTRQIGVAEAAATSWPRLVLDQTWATLKMFGVRGARDGFFNLPYRPVFPGVLQIPFYAGVIVALRHWRRPESAIVLLWLGVMLLPTILAADAPHWLRAIGAAPATSLLWGLGIMWILDFGVWILGRAGQVWRQGAKEPRSQGDESQTSPSLPASASPPLVSPRLIAIAALVLSLGWAWTTTHAYFNVWARRPELYYEYMQYATDAARESQRVPGRDSLLISEEYYRHATYLYLAPRSRSAQWYDARHAVVWPRSAPWTAIISVSTPTTDDLAPLLVEARGEPYAPDGLFAYMKLQGDTIPPFAPPVAHESRFGDVLRLTGYEIIGDGTPGDSIHVRLWLQTLSSPGRELRVFAHLEDDQARVLAQNDALGYDAREWQPGDRFISFHTLALPDDMPGSARLVVGLYDAVTGQRYPASGTGAQGDYVELPLP